MEIHPKKFGDLLNEWFRSLGRNWKPLLISSLVVHIPLAIILTLVFWLSGAGEAFALYLDPEALETMSDAAIFEAFTPLLWVIAIWTILQLLAAVFVYLAAARTVAGDTAGETFTWGQVSRFATSKTPTGVVASLLVLIGAALLVGAATAIGWAVISASGTNFATVFLTATAALTALVVLTWLGLSFSFAMQTISMDRVGPVTALRLSFKRVQSRWWATFGYLLLASLIGSAASQVVSLVIVPVFALGAVVPELLGVAFGASVILQGPLLAAIGAAYSIWYIDLRARDETLQADQLI